MKPLYKLFIILTFVFPINSYGVGFNSITTSDGINLIAVGNSGLLFRSANGGNSWATFTNGNLNQNCVTSFNNDIWIAAQNGNVFKTLKTNSPIYNYNVGSSSDLNSIYFINSLTGYVCGYSGNVYKSTNGGVNWFSSNTGIPSTKLNSINFKDVNTGTVVGDNGLIYITTNGGLNWFSQPSGTSRNLIKVKYFNDSLVSVGEYGTLLLNNGSGWNPISTRINSTITGVSGRFLNDLHVCGDGGFIRNNRNNSSKFLNFEINPMIANLSDIIYFDGNIGFAISNINNIIIKTIDAGLSWTTPIGSSISYQWQLKLSASSGIGNNLCAHPTDKNAFFCGYGNKVYVSRNRGDNWTQIATNLPGSALHSFYVSPLDTNIWIGAIESSPDKVIRSTNYGVTWTVSTSANFSNYGQPLEMDQNDPHVFYYAPDNGGFFKSTDIGTTFSQISAYPFRSPCDIIIMWDSANVIFVGDGITGSGNAIIYKSVNSGVNWTAVKTVAASEVPSMCNNAFAKNILYATEWSGSNIYKTIDYGDNWFITHNTGFSGWASGNCLEDPTVSLIGNYGSSSALSVDNGSTWTNISGLGGAGAGILIPERNLILNMQTSGIYKLNVNYSYVPTSIDVQALSLGDTGSQFYTSSTINPQGQVQNNNPNSTATFTVTRKINPGGYTNTQLITNLASNTSTIVTFAPWTFSSGITYSIKDSVYIAGDNYSGNDKLSGSITPFSSTITTKLNEGFSSGTFPPMNWSITYTGISYWYGSSVSSYGSGVGSSKFDIWNASIGTNQSLNTLTFSSSVSGDSLKFDLAYSPFPSGTDSLIIQVSNDSGNSFSDLTHLYGNSNVGSTLNTTGVTTTEFTPVSNQWGTRAFSLPVGTNKIKFKGVSGYGNNIYIDYIRVFGITPLTFVNLKIVPEGLYNRFTLNKKNTVTAYLRSLTPPYNKLDSSKGVLDTITFIAPMVYQNITTGNYYIQVNDRNSIETWSKPGGETIVSGSINNYDFTTSQSQAYGNNLTLKNGIYCIYSGDINQDRQIDLTDIITIYNDANLFRTGDLVTDLNGDYTVSLTDVIIGYNNSANFIRVKRP